VIEIVSGMIDHRLSDVDDRRMERCAFCFPLVFSQSWDQGVPSSSWYGCIAQPREVEQDSYLRNIAWNFGHHWRTKRKTSDHTKIEERILEHYSSSKRGICPTMRVAETLCRSWSFHPTPSCFFYTGFDCRNKSIWQVPKPKMLAGSLCYWIRSLAIPPSSSWKYMAF
jgi:hypothetical protein